MNSIPKGGEGKFVSALATSLDELLQESFPDRPMKFILAFYEAKAEAEPEGIAEIGMGYFVTSGSHKHAAKLMRGLAEKIESAQAELN